MTIQYPIKYQNSPEKLCAVGDVIIFYSHSRPYAIPAQIVEFKNKFEIGETLVSNNIEQLLEVGTLKSDRNMLILRIENDENILIHFNQIIEKNERFDYISHEHLETGLNFKQLCENYLKSRVDFDAEACYQLGLWNFIGLIHDQDLTQAKQLWENATDKGHLIAPCYLAEMFYSEAQDIEGKKFYIDLLEMSATRGYAIAQYSLGYFYSEASQQDFTKAIYWYEKAAAQNYAQAQCNLADKYEHGLGVVKDYAKAIQLYQQAAEQNIAEAMYSLANMILNEKGLIKNIDLAKAYLMKAIELKYEPAQYLLTQIDEA
ncbi:tetratricopeptide repeat protein [Acinetobacter sp. Marseille-Q1618]|uniref:tetratricopeptide repeat protein n=1 Tax=Acinetobacter sp. Marseille-Q1618 TaxID=2697502 RepID=UPI00156FEF04|nr:tetratricopeptide repeat protein [Acinetobacter sp. Marseille-Q1618]